MYEVSLAYNGYLTCLCIPMYLLVVIENKSHNLKYLRVKKQIPLIKIFFFSLIPTQHPPPPLSPNQHNRKKSPDMFVDIANYKTTTLINTREIKERQSPKVRDDIYLR